MSIIVLTNHAGFDSQRCTLKIARVVLGLPPIERMPVTISGAVQDRLIGKYLINGKWPVEIKRVDAHLIYKTPDEEKPFWPLDETRFYVEGNEEKEVVFSDEQAGHFTKLTWVSLLHSVTAERAREIPGETTT